MANELCGLVFNFRPNKNLSIKKRLATSYVSAHPTTVISVIKINSPSVDDTRELKKNAATTIIV